MKKIFKSLILFAAAATVFSACNKEADIQETAKTGEFTTIRFSAKVNDVETKATLTTEDESTFKAAWENNDKMDLEVSGNGHSDSFEATWKGSYFEFDIPSDWAEEGTWAYGAYYPSKSNVPFGSNRQQKGSIYASQYDVMLNEFTEFKNSKCGYDSDGGHIVLPMTRATSILYFHLTSDLLDENIESATLTVKGGDIAADYLAYNTSDLTFAATESSQKYNTITITFAEGTAPSASDFCLWYNILPVTATGLTLTVTTTSGKTATLTNTKGKTYAAGKLNKIVKGVTFEEEEPQEQSYSIIFIDKKIKNETAIATTTKAETVIENSSLQYVTESPFADVTKAFYGGDETNGKPLRIGTSGASGSLTIELSDEGTVYANSVVINAKQYSSGKTKTIGVNDSDMQQPGDSYGDLTYTVNSDLTNIVLQTDGYIYVKYITVYYTPKETVTLSFPESSYVITQGDSFTSPSLTINPSGLAVTYSSSNESVATVDENTGAVTLSGGIGSTTITATFAGNETYKSASASYTLTVNRAAATSIAQIKSDLANGATEFSATLTNAVVTRKYSDYIAYLQDNSAGILVTDAADLTEGDSYSGTVSGEMSTANDQPKITAIDVSQMTKTTGASKTPETVTIANLTSDMSSYDGRLCKIVKAKANSTLATGTNKSIVIAQGDNSMTLFTRASFPENTIVKDSYYDIIGIPCKYNSTNEIVVVSTADVSTSGITWQLSAISVKTKPKSSYKVGDYFDPTGLVLATTMADVSDASITKVGNDVSYGTDNASSFSFDPNLTTELTTDNTSVSITYGEKTTSMDISVTTSGNNTYTYTFTSKSWGATLDGAVSNWTSGKDGAGFSNNGIQVTTNVSGANGTTQQSFTNVSQVVVTYNTNKSAGAGNLNLKIGNNTAHTENWAYSGSSDGRSANFTCVFDVSNESGSVTLTANTTTNSIYIVSVAVTAQGISE